MRTVMAEKTLSIEPTVDPSAKLQGAKLGAYCEVGARTILLDVDMGDYSYVAERLMRLAWWDWDHEALRAALPDFRKLGIGDFLEKYENAVPSSRSIGPRRGASW